MEYLKVDIQQPVEYISGGRFVTEDPWRHDQRIINDYEIIIGINDVLYIEQEGTKYTVKPGEVLLILPNRSHGGYKICNKHVSFYWFHFYTSHAAFGVPLEQEEIIKIRTQPEISRSIKEIYIPSYASPVAIQRLNILANQLLDVDNSNYYTRMSMNYLMTSLLIELSEQTILHPGTQPGINQGQVYLNQILEWIRINAFEGITVSDVAEKFCYHKDYLSRFFKRKTGKTIQEYIHSLRISKAKDLLTGTRENIKTIANKVGIADEKYFMRLFKKYEKMTPSEYRKAFNKTHFNRK